MAQHSKHGDLGTALGFAMLLLGLLLVAPGVVTVYLGARLLGPDLDCGQHWAFGIAAAFLEYLAIRITCPERPALKTYLAVCAGTVGLLGLAYWGFHARWPAELMAALGGGTP